MSLKFFFNRNGLFPTLVIFVGWILQIIHSYFILNSQTKLSSLNLGFYALFLSMVFIITLCRIIPWYSKKDRGHGIEEHFSKNMVATGYILALVGFIFFFTQNIWPLLLFFNLFFALVLMVNFFILRFHFLDKDQTPPSYFARSLYNWVKD